MKKIAPQYICVIVLLLCFNSILHAGAGDLDLSFDGDGKVNTDFNANSDERATSIAIQSDGKLVVAGVTFGTTANFALARYNTDGSVDGTFGSAGRVTSDFAGSGDYANGVAIQADGKIVAAGIAFVATQDFGIARYNTNGALDTTFSSDGKVTTEFGQLEAATALAIQPDGKIVVTGYTQNNMGSDSVVIARYNTDGSLDNSFDFDGKIIMDFGVSSAGEAIAIDASGRIVIAGIAYNNPGTSNNFGLARFNPDGSVDSTFGTGGKVTTDFAGSVDSAEAVAIQPDGKIVVVGEVNTGISYDFGAARYNSDGTLDLSFNFDGKTTLDISGDDDFPHSVLLQPDGKIVVSGTGTGASNDFAAARFRTPTVASIIPSVQMEKSSPIFLAREMSVTRPLFSQTAKSCLPAGILSAA